MKFIIKRDSWIQGQGIDTYLFLPDSKYCCFGFLAKELGYCDDDLKDIQELITLTNNKNLFPESLILSRKNYDKILTYPTKICCEIMEINDNKEISIAEKENKLIELFKVIDIELVFE